MEFFSQQELDNVDAYAKQEVVPEKFKQLKDTYNKLEFLCQLICKNTNYSYQIRKDPRKQAGKNGFVFQDYLWAKIYITEYKSQCFDKLAYVIGISGGTINFHIMGVKQLHQTEASLKATQSSWAETKVDEIDGYEKLVNKFYDYEKRFRTLFLKTAIDLHIIQDTNQQFTMKIQEITNLLQYKKQIILQGPPGTGKTRSAMEIAQEIAAPKSITEANIKEILSVGQSIKSATAYTVYTVKSIGTVNVTVGLSNSSSEYKPSYKEIIAAYEIRMWDGKQSKGNDPYAAALAKFIYENIFLTQTKVIQFHPSYSYEDFVRGIIAESKGEAIEYKNVNKILGKFASDAKKSWDDNSKEGTNISKENKSQEYFHEFVDQLTDRITGGENIALTPSVNLINVEETAFRYKGTDGWTALGNRMSFKDIIQAYLDGNKVRQDIKQNKNLSGLANQHATYFIKVLNMFQDYIADNNLSFENLSSEKPELKNYVLIIDEINRANLSSVLGELIYALEYRGEPVESMYEVDGNNTLVLPPNLYIIGTMNTADRSVGHIDYAIRRRFSFVDVLPKDLSSELGVNFHKSLFDQVADLFEANLSQEFEKKDVQLGHSYFIDKTSEGGTMSIRLEHEIKPILMEYVKDGILIGDRIKQTIESLTAQ